MDRVHETQGRVVPPGQQLAELARLADHDDRAIGIPRPQPVHHVLEPRPVQRAEALDHTGDRPTLVVDRDRRGGHVPVRVAGDDRERRRRVGRRHP